MFSKVKLSLTNTEVYPLGSGIELVLVHGVEQGDRVAAARQTHQHLVSRSHHVVFVDGLQVIKCYKC